MSYYKKLKLTIESSDFFVGCSFLYSKLNKQIICIAVFSDSYLKLNRIWPAWMCGTFVSSVPANQQLQHFYRKLSELQVHVHWRAYRSQCECVRLTESWSKFVHFKFQIYQSRWSHLMWQICKIWLATSFQQRRYTKRLFFRDIRTRLAPWWGNAL